MLCLSHNIVINEPLKCRESTLVFTGLTLAIPSLTNPTDLLHNNSPTAIHVCEPCDTMSPVPICCYTQCIMRWMAGGGFFTTQVQYIVTHDYIECSHRIPQVSYVITPWDWLCLFIIFINSPFTISLLHVVLNMYMKYCNSVRILFLFLLLFPSWLFSCIDSYSKSNHIP